VCHDSLSSYARIQSHYCCQLPAPFTRKLDTPLHPINVIDNSISLLWSPALAYSESEASVIFCGAFLSTHFLRSRKTDIPENFPHDVADVAYVFNRTFAIPISSKCPLKRTGAEKPKICPIFVPSCRQLASKFWKTSEMEI